MEPSPLTPEVLLAHAGWMRALARGLLRDPADADEVLQEASLAALRRPPQDPAAAEAWLARVVRNFAWRRLREDARRARREECAARPESVPAQYETVETLERLELQGILLEAVRALDEPYRTTIVQRYFEERSSAEIARTTGVPAGTVRWRLKHGLEELRQRLDRRFGLRDAWSVLLAPIAWRDGAPPPPVLGGGALATATMILQGVVAMSLVKLALVAAGLVIAGVSLWSVARSATPSTSPPVAVLAEDGAPDATPLPTAAAVGAAAQTPADSRTEVQPLVVAPAVSALPEEPASARVEVRFVDANGTPWPGVRFEALDPAREGGPGAGALATTSDEQGRVALAIPFPGFVPEEDGMLRWQFQFLALRAGCATRKLEALLTSNTLARIGDVVLVPGVRVLGRVLDGEGAPVAGALVGGAPPELPPDEGRLRRRGCDAFDADLATRTAADGSFVIAGIAPGPWRLWAHAPGTRFAWTEVLAVPAERDLSGVELWLAPLLASDRIAGRVLDPSGAPAPYASLASLARKGEHASYEWLQADALGRFELVLAGDCEAIDLTARDARRSRAGSATGIVPGTLDLELWLADSRSLSVRVRDGDGRPVAGVRFEIDYGATGEDLEPRVTAAGHYELLCPAIEIRAMQIGAPGFLEASRGPWRPETLPGELEVVLQRSARVRGLVVADGKPLAAARVELREHYPDANVLVNGLRCVQSTFPRSSATTDDQGRFELDGDPGRSYVVRATAPGRAPSEAGPLGAGGSEELELTQGGVIEGYVLVAPGRPAEGTIVVANHGDGEARTQRAGPRGFFRFEGLASGSWQVLARDEEIGPHATSYGPYKGDQPIEWSCAVEAGRTTRFDLDLTQR